MLRHYAIMLGLIAASTAHAQDAAKEAETRIQPGMLEEVIVTAQKREQRLNDVPMSIAAVTGEQLQKQGVTQPADLTRIVPGLTFQPSDFASPVYTIRGVGQKDNGVAVSPTVSVYVDQVPIPYSVQTLGAAFDIERLEVLKGPQGTLFGQNSTGGSINFIAAKPTSNLDAGARATYGRFDEVDAQAFLSGPLSETVSARIAVGTEQRGEWQVSQTRPGDELGKRNFSTGRLLVDWNPSEEVRFEFSANGWLDKSDTQAAQFVAYAPAVPNGYPDIQAELAAYEPAPDDARVADWDPNKDLQRDDDFGQFSLRADWSISPTLTLTSITAWSNYHQFGPLDLDGTNLNDIPWTLDASIEALSQELRVAGQQGEAIHWMIGANYQSDSTRDDQHMVNYAGSNSGVGPLRYDSFYNSNHQEIETKAIFASLDYRFTDTLTAQASVRYTTSTDDFRGCVFDAGDGELAAAFSLLASSPIGPGQCVTLDPATFAPVPIVSKSLDESNVPWRVGLSWKPTQETLYYANVTKGYKAGTFSTVPGLFTSQFNPVTQEAVLSYEVGFKSELLDRSLQLTGAAFYYDYDDKQLIGTTITAFGQLPALVSIPKSRVQGAELNAIWRPVAALRLSAGATYVDSEVTDHFATTDPFNNQVDLKGESFPNTPKWQLSADAEYEFAITSDVTGFVGASGSYRSDTSAAFGSSPMYVLDSYGLLDLRAGVDFDQWRVQAWGRNVTDKFYVQTVTHVTDTVARITGMPAAYGLTVTYRLR